jgi:hypothetical protein
MIMLDVILSQQQDLHHTGGEMIQGKRKMSNNEEKRMTRLYTSPPETRRGRSGERVPA